jgi:hypothetical protein
MPQLPHDAKEDLVHLLVFFVLIFAALFVATKFKVIHCSQVPGSVWCPTYCSVAGNSKVAFVTDPNDEGGIGNSSQLMLLAQRARIRTPMVSFNLDQISSGLLKNYELVVLENARTYSNRQAEALQAYVANGGSLLVIGDVFTNATLTADDLLLAASQDKPTARPSVDKDTKATIEPTAQLLPDNNTRRVIERVERSRSKGGFGILADFFGAQYQDTLPSSKNFEFRVINVDHLAMSGVRPAFTVPDMPFAHVIEGDNVDKLAVLRGTDGKEYPAIVEKKLAGRTIYTSFPLEMLNSTTMIENLFDYLVVC